MLAKLISKKKKRVAKIELLSPLFSTKNHTSFIIDLTNLVPKNLNNIAAKITK